MLIELIYLPLGDIHTLLPIKNNRIVAASNKFSLGKVVLN